MHHLVSAQHHSTLISKPHDNSILRDELLSIDILDGTNIGHSQSLERPYLSGR